MAGLRVLSQRKGDSQAKKHNTGCNLHTPSPLTPFPSSSIQSLTPFVVFPPSPHSQWLMEKCLTPLWFWSSSVGPVDVRAVGQTMALDYIENRYQNDSLRAFHRLRSALAETTDDDVTTAPLPWAPFNGPGHLVMAGSTAILDEWNRHQAEEAQSAQEIAQYKEAI